MMPLVAAYVLPAAAALLPAEMDSLQARAMLLAIGLQETRFSARRQVGGGPARGFWQFETGGVRGVLTHWSTRSLVPEVLRRLRYDQALAAEQLQPFLEHNDILAAAFARLLMWTSPRKPREEHEVAEAWGFYVDVWRPGKPRPDDWANCYTQAWRAVRPRPPAQLA